MEDLQYINLHVHSIGSLRDGILKIEDLVEFALKHDKKYVAATDHGSISEWIQLYNQCKSNKLTPIFGIELYIHHEREKLLAEREDDPSHLILLALNEIGFYNIIKIHNDAWQHLYRKKKSRIARPIASYDCLFEHHEGIVVTTACIAGRLPKLLLEGNEKEAALYIERMKEVFQDRLFMELMLNDMEKQKILNKKLIKIAMQYDLKTILTSDAHYLRKEDSRTYERKQRLEFWY